MGIFIFFAIVFFIWIYADAESRRLKEMTPEQRQAYQNAQHEARLTAFHGPRNPAFVCPHCHATGAVRTKPVTQKKGVSGGKATAALLTGGTSLLVTGLSRKESLTQALCQNCGSTWIF